MSGDLPRRSVVLLRRGVAWDESKPLLEQEGVHDHLAYLGALHGRGVLERGGPFHRPTELLDGELVGLLVYATDRERALGHAARDPAVRTGLLAPEVLSWYA